MKVAFQSANKNPLNETNLLNIGSYEETQKRFEDMILKNLKYLKKIK
jgi:hypothetical protein